MKLNKTEKFVLDLMRQSPIHQAFVVGAIDLHVTHVLDHSPRVLFINPQAWHQTALDAQQALHTYTSGA